MTAPRSFSQRAPPPREAREAEQRRCITVAVLGNPNAGKTTIFNRLTGLSQKVGNYPGVTVERKEGFAQLGDRAVRLLDLPGTYSLAAHSPDEMVAVDVLLSHQEGEAQPDLVLVVADASNLERNLYLFSQVRELGLPAVLALNMADIALGRGIRVDTECLAARLGVRVVLTQGHRGEGIAELRRALREALEDAGAAASTPVADLPVSGAAIPEGEEALRREAAALQGEVALRVRERLGRPLHAFEVLRALVDREGHAEERLLRLAGESFRSRLEEARARAGGGRPLAALEAEARYAWIRERLLGCLKQVAPSPVSWTDRLDAVLTHKVLGYLVFAAMMLLVFQSLFTWAQPVMDGVDAAFARLGELAGGALPPGTLRSLLTDGVVAGVGSVVVFLPQIVILFFFIGLLEDCGYMARAAFLMDRIMSKCGLSGKSFIPMLSGFACAVPAVMAARVVDNRRDRIATILVTPLMSCSARLPIYSILIGTFIPDTPLLGGILRLQAATLFGLYLLGIAVAVAMAWVFKRTILRGPAPPFVLELPTYKLPSLSTVLFRLYDRAVAFLLRAGTVILAITVIVWALAYFPRDPELGGRFAGAREAAARELQGLPEASPEKTRLEERIRALEREEAGEALRQSYLGRMGQAVAPLFRPLGWDWKISVAAIASFPAREIVVSTLGTIYNLGSESDPAGAELGEQLRAEVWPESGRRVFTVPVALSILVFFALCCQCGATLATIRRETNSWGWAGFTFGYMTALAYLGALLTYQAGAFLGGGPPGS